MSPRASRIFAVALVALIFLLLAGCGGGEDLDDEPAKPVCPNRSCMI